MQSVPSTGVSDGGLTRLLASDSGLDLLRQELLLALLATTADPHAASDSSGSTNSLYKTELCRSWQETGTCRYGGKCQFAHGPHELRPVQRHPKYKTEFCRTFAQSGTCPYGSRCRFIHLSSNPAASLGGDDSALLAARIAAAAAASSPAGANVALFDRAGNLTLEGLGLQDLMKTIARHQQQQQQYQQAAAATSEASLAASLAALGLDSGGIITNTSAPLGQDLAYLPHTPPAMHAFGVSQAKADHLGGLPPLTLQRNALSGNARAIIGQGSVAMMMSGGQPSGSGLLGGLLRTTSDLAMPSANANLGSRIRRTASDMQGRRLPVFRDLAN